MPLVLTFDDLDDIGADAIHAADPTCHRRELLEAVEQGYIADTADTAWALTIAAGIAERSRDETQALSLVARAVEAAEGDFARGAARTRQAELWLSFGHVEQAMHTLRELRPLLTRDPYAVCYLVNALVAHDRAHLAEQWLSAAYIAATRNAGRYVPGAQAIWHDAQNIADTLAIVRRRVRDGLGLPPDAADLRAAKLLAILDQEADLRFWPEAAFTELVTAAPELTGTLGASWAEHRTIIERTLADAYGDGRDLVVEIGTPALLADVLGTSRSADVLSCRLLDWPPGRTDPCWCGSSARYMTCCLPRREVAARQAVPRSSVCRSGLRGRR